VDRLSYRLVWIASGRLAVTASVNKYGKQVSSSIFL
jgi:hypothetical protein